MIRWGAIEVLSWLWVLIPVAWGMILLVRRRNRRVETMLDPEIIPILLPRWKRIRVRTRAMYWLAGIALLIMALARPQWGFHWEEVRRRGLDILVVLDTSRSMTANDIKPNRLQQAKWGIRDLIQHVHGDRLGLVTFAGSSFLQCPLTIDYAAFLITLDDVYAGIIPRGGTAIANALETAIDSFEYESNADRAIVLVTDGEDHEGEPSRLVEELRKRNIRVYAVGVGTLEGELIPQFDENSEGGFLKDKEGRIVKSSLQENELKEIALATGGMYVRSAPGDFGLDQIYEKGINQLQREDQESRMIKAYEDRYYWFVGAALVLLLVEGILTERNGNRRNKQILNAQ